MRFHFLFEQSGTFKNAAIKLGHDAFDYDLVKTLDVDFQLDIFEQNDRTKYGDVLKKPTAYWFVNEEPNFLDMPYHYKDTKGHIVDLAKGISRSLIDCDYALNFLSHYFGEVKNEM